MCGLVGVAGKIDWQTSKVFRNMLIFDQFRGRDSTGVFSLYEDHEKNVLTTTLLKEIGAPELLFEFNEEYFTDGVYDKDTSLLMGHNRAATQGLINQENAHPFDFPNVVGCHNGTVPMIDLKGFHGYKDFSIDSQIIFSQLNHDPDVQWVWSNADDGAMALVWFDFRENKLKFIRNSHRPLYYYISTDNKTLYWASEPWMITLAMQQVKRTKVEPKAVPINTLFEFDILNSKDPVYVPNTKTVTYKYDDITYSSHNIEPPVRKYNWGNWLNYGKPNKQKNTPKGKEKGQEKVGDSDQQILIPKEIHKLSEGYTFFLEVYSFNPKPYLKLVRVMLKGDDPSKIWSEKFGNFDDNLYVVNSRDCKFALTYFDNLNKTEDGKGLKTILFETTLDKIGRYDRPTESHECTYCKEKVSSEHHVYADIYECDKCACANSQRFH